MKNFHYLLPFLLLLATTSLSSKSKHPVSTSKSRLAAGDIAYVLAEHGLTLRLAAGVKSQKIKTLNHCDSVKIIGYDDPPEPYSVNEFKGFDITGAWVKVIADLDTGYVFDGYLSKWECIKNPNNNNDNGAYHYYVIRYLKKHFMATKKNHKVIKEWSKGRFGDQDIGLKLSNGTSFDCLSSNPGGGYVISIPDSLITIAEAYLIFIGTQKKQYPCRIEKKVNSYDDYPDHNYKPIGGAIEFDNEMEAAFIYKKRDKIVINNQWTE